MESTRTADSSNAARDKQQFLEAYDREHAITMRVLRSFPEDQLDLQPHPTSRSARELGWMFVLERGLGETVFTNQFEAGGNSGKRPEPPERWSELLNALEEAHKRFARLIESTPAEELYENVRFLTGPQTVGDVRRIDWLWFLLSDEIHHRGQFSVYLRMSGAKVPSIYGPSRDEPWF